MFSALGPSGAIHELAQTPSGQALVLGWLFVMGTLLGSFANVVVHRLPRRRSLLWPPSHCPRCKHAIRWRDNLPIVGWMLLDGKCRDCGLPISPQYVFVETMFGILLATIGWLEGVEGRANLPVRPSFAHDSPPSDWIFVAYHMLLVGTLACAALMQQDRKPVSRSLLVFSGWWGLALPLIWTAIRPVPLGLVLPEMLSVSSAMLAGVEGAAGMVVGILVGLLVWPAMPEGRAPRDRQVDAIYELGMIGTFLGWQAVCGIAIVALALLWISQLLALAWPRATHLTWTTWLAGTTFVWVCFWSTIVRTMPWWGKSADGTVLIGACLVLAAASPLMRLLAQRSEAPLAVPSPQE
ncbi:MAG TPA: prepilin peptidase [Pirellulales bacterium]|jgi:leader peptidase (prepilin peptidase)/N-methyltransferase|nr:prepilin peptidase [Pirellulales bacterium]